MTDLEKKWRLLIVDDEPNNLQLLRQILKGTYQLSMATSGQQALEIANKVKPDLILLDVMMPGLDGYETCKKLKAEPLTHKVPVIFTTAKTEVKDEKYGFDVGAVDYITKPISGPIVHARVATHLALYDQQRAMQIQIMERTTDLAESQKAAIHMLGEAGHYNDTDTGLHIWRMAAYSATLARKMGWKVSKAEQLEYTAPMHDTGKIGIPDAILKKPGKLSVDEWGIMKQHSQIGYDILSKSKTPLFQMAAEIALCHHEKWNGFGYPNNLKETEIPESARIVAIADVFDALTMKRPYKDAWPIAKAFDELKKGSGTHFDPKIVECFFDNQLEMLAVKEKWEVMEENGVKAF